MKSKKNRFFNFCWSLLPGCGEMYMGFMKMGLSLMIIFWGILGMAVMLECGPLMFPAVIVWFYSFFHARNLVHMPEGDFLNLEDEYLFHVVDLDWNASHMKRGYRKVIAVVLIVAGVALTMDGLRSMMYFFMPSILMRIWDGFMSYLPRLAAGLGIIALGLWMIRGKKAELWEEEIYREAEAMNEEKGHMEFREEIWSPEMEDAIERTKEDVMEDKAEDKVKDAREN